MLTKACFNKRQLHSLKVARYRGKEFQRVYTVKLVLLFTNQNTSVEIHIKGTAIIY